MAQCKNCVRLFKNYDEENQVLVGNWCDKIFDDPDVEEERDCRWYKAKTNGDMIRAMSDEELARWLYFQYGDKYGDSQMDVLDWLRKEVGCGTKEKRSV